MHVGFKVVGTLLFGGPLMSYFLGAIMAIAASINKPKDFSDFFFSLGGKINRKWYFFNCLILLTITLVLGFINVMLSNWVMFIISVPYFLILYILHWNNCYKRFNAITDNHKLSLFFVISWGVISIFLGFINNKVSQEFAFLVNSILTAIWLLLLFVPSKSVQEKDADA